MPVSDMNPILLRSFVAVAETGGFTAAAVRLGLGQSTVSQHVRKLEEVVGRRLLLRDTHSIAVTEDGNVMLDLAREILRANDRAAHLFTAAPKRARLRIGISEDFAMSRLAEILVELRHAQPLVDVELAVGLSYHLYSKYDAGELDVIFAKRKSGDRRGKVAWRSPLVWVGSRTLELHDGEILPLVCYQPPSITRTLAIEALNAAGISWRVACSSGSLSGLQAALQAGLGAAAFSGDLIPPGLISLSRNRLLPKLPEVEFVALSAGKSNRAAEYILSALTRSGRMGELLGYGASHRP